MTLDRSKLVHKVDLGQKRKVPDAVETDEKDSEMSSLSLESSIHFSCCRRKSQQAVGDG